MRYLGIDLAWGEGSEARPANRSGVVTLEPGGTINDAGWTIGLDAAVEWIEQHAADNTLLFVDAPLVITNATGPRSPTAKPGSATDAGGSRRTRSTSARPARRDCIYASGSSLSGGATPTDGAARPAGVGS
jgi:hypothetical protein